jgi:hypothetical protein
MKKKYVPFNLALSLLIWCIWVRVEAQSLIPQKEVIISKVDLLFDAMRANDSTMVSGLFTDQAMLSSIYLDKNTNQVVKRSSPVSKFVTAIGTPHIPKWDERIWSYEVQVDGPMAYVWTEYTFYLDKLLTHCGVNVFELINTDKGWQISAITDTRRNNDCRTEPVYDIHNLIDNWHRAAATADEDIFFGSMTADGIYIGTDETERWTRDEMFKLLGKYFQKESAWDFKATSRNVLMHDDGKLAWFDELLDTWMGTCRSSGVVKLTDQGWQIAHYHLSIAVPNDKVNDYLKIIGKERK